MNKLSRYERLHGKRGANKAARIQRMKERILRRRAKEAAQAIVVE